MFDVSPFWLSPSAQTQALKKAREVLKSASESTSAASSSFLNKTRDTQLTIPGEEETIKQKERRIGDHVLVGGDWNMTFTFPYIGIHWE